MCLIFGANITKLTEITDFRRWKIKNNLGTFRGFKLEKLKTFEEFLQDERFY